MESAADKPMEVVGLRQCLGEFATGVAVITAQGDGLGIVGMTVNSFNSVSLDPPLVLFSVNRRARSLPAMLEARAFTINVLARDQEHVSLRFAGKSGEKWSNIQRAMERADAPLIAGAIAHFEGEPYANYDGGDHIIFVIKVLSYSIDPTRPPPLIFFRGQYRSLTDEATCVSY